MSEKQTILVFVYGTLKRGLSNHWIMQRHDGARFVGEDSVLGFDIYDLGHYPCAVPSDPTATVHGEVFEVCERTLRSLDALEGYPSHYDRTMVDTSAGHAAWIYHYRQEDAPDGRPISSGRWTPTRRWT